MYGVPEPDFEPHARRSLKLSPPDRIDHSKVYRSDLLSRIFVLVFLPRFVIFRQKLDRSPLLLMDEPASPPSAGCDPDEEPASTVVHPPVEGDGPDDGPHLVLGPEGQLTFIRGGGAT